MIYRVAKWSSAIVVAMSLVACAGPVPKIDLAPDAMANTRTITIVRPPEPNVYTVANFGHGGMAFGLIGGVIAAADQNSKQEQLAKAYKDNGVSVCRELSQKISDRLNSLGFDAKVEDGPWEEADGKKILPFNKIVSDADAVLVVSPTIIGFVATGLAGGYNNDYLPTIATVVTLLGKDRNKPIYRGYHVTGWQLKAAGWQYIPPTTTFPNFEALYSNPKASSISLMVAADKIANSITTDLRHQQRIVEVVTSLRSNQRTIDQRVVPYINATGQQRFAEYLTKQMPRAFAISDNGHYGYAWGKKPKDPNSPADPKERALKLCAGFASKECVLFSVDDQIVFQQEGDSN